MAPHEIVRKLIGNINPSGESNADEEALNNFEAMCTLVENLLYDIDDIIQNNKGDERGSVKKIVEEAKKFMSEKVKPIVNK